MIYVPVAPGLGLPVGPWLLWVFPLVGLFIVLGAGLAMIVAALQVYFRDLKSFMPYLLRVWLYGSPVLYYAYEMPEQYRWLLDVNPLGQLLGGMERRDQPGPPADEPALLVGSAWAFGLLLVGFLYFVSRERDFAVRL